MMQLYPLLCGNIKETFSWEFQNSNPILLQHLFHFIKYDKNPPLEASIDPESSDESES